ncbi:MAG: hypothetical protein FWE42_01400 [Defluviitaleaceae bacterium]|nr:hypothetical protein [Defluviitaleaceae bacterium]
MAVTSTHLAGTLRFINDEDEAVNSYQRIRPNIQGVHVENFLQSVLMLRGETGGNAFLTLTTELEETGV